MIHFYAADLNILVCFHPRVFLLPWEAVDAGEMVVRFLLALR